MLDRRPRAVPYAELAAGWARPRPPCRWPSTGSGSATEALLLEEIAATLDDPAEVADEIRALFAALE